MATIKIHAFGDDVPIKGISGMTFEVSSVRFDSYVEYSTSSYEGYWKASDGESVYRLAQEIACYLVNKRLNEMIFEGEMASYDMPENLEVSYSVL